MTRPVTHRTTVTKRSMFHMPKRMWWMTCTCGWFNGFHHKQDALDYADAHVRENDQA